MTIANRIRRWVCKVCGHNHTAHWTWHGGTGLKCVRCGHITWFGHGPGLAAYYYHVSPRPSSNWGNGA